MQNDFLEIIYFAVCLIISVIIHEIAHGWVANKLGDPTARLEGRLSLNPLKHIDPFGSVVLPLFLLLSGSGFVFGWAKPVPVDERYFKRPTRDNLLVSSAGIAANILLAALCGTCIRLLGRFDANVLTMLLASFFFILMLVNLILAAFNLIPVPPLDGSKIFLGWIDKPWAQNYLHSPRSALLGIGIIFIVLPLLFQTLGSENNPLTFWLRGFTETMIKMLL